MLKISPKITKPVQRYFMKNTVRAKYDRNMDTALVSGVAGVTEMLRLPVWEPHDIGIFAFVGTLYLKSVSKAFRCLKELQPIRKRAIQIKKSAKFRKEMEKEAVKRAYKPLISIGYFKNIKTGNK